MNLFFKLLIVFWMLLLVGCFTSASNEPEHKKLIGTQFQLKKSWYLCANKETARFDKRATHYITKNLKNNNHENCSLLPIGTEMTIEEINKYRNVSVGDTWIGVILNVVDPISTKEVKVLKFWDERLYGPDSMPW